MVVAWLHGNMVRGREGYSGATQGTQKKPWETKAVVSRAVLGRREGDQHVKCSIQVLRDEGWEIRPNW